MKLSEAILLGSIGTEQAFGVLKTTDGRTCALGAAMTAMGMNLEGLDELTRWKLFRDIASCWPVTKVHAQCPACNWGPVTVEAGIWHLNDKHGWPRPQIAAWVATLEEHIESQSVQETPNALSCPGQ